ncbi:MAG: RNA methyltransferase [Bauldia sp.]
MSATPPTGPKAAAPAIVLVEPQLGENIGTAARAMANFGLADLRLVNPREGWPNDKARAAASGADHVIEGARVFVSLPEAIGELGFVYAMTARAREAARIVAGPREAAAKARRLLAGGTGVGILVGRERIGLTNDEVSLADQILTLPVDPAFSSLNVAQAVLIVAYEWRLSGVSAEADGLPFDGGLALPAAKADLIRLFEHLETALDEAAFFRPPEKRPHMVKALRAMLQRAGLTDQEVRTLRGAVAALGHRPTRPHRLADGTLTTKRGGGE